MCVCVGVCSSPIPAFSDSTAGRTRKLGDFRVYETLFFLPWVDVRHMDS